MRRRGRHFLKDDIDHDLYLEALSDAYKANKQAERLKDRLAQVTLEHAQEMRKLRQDYDHCLECNRNLAAQLCAAEAAVYLKGEG